MGSILQHFFIVFCVYKTVDNRVEGDSFIDLQGLDRLKQERCNRRHIHSFTVKLIELVCVCGIFLTGRDDGDGHGFHETSHNGVSSRMRIAVSPQFRI